MVWQFLSHKRYEAVPKDDEEERIEDPVTHKERERCFLSARFFWLGLAILVVTLAVAAIWTFSIAYIHGLEELQLNLATPSNVSLRREWRTLSRAEQTHYIESVRCLLTKPSVLLQNSSSYADFPFIHSRVGWYTHHAAAFLPWHRYFLHIYEETLRSQCGFNGSLTYWDWTLDSADIASSVVFDPVTGFGGDGDVSGETTVGTSGHCLKDGPFKDVVADFYDTSFKPHCLSRGFHDDAGNLGHIDGKDISPASIEQALASDSYEDFVNALESKVHDAIPFGLGGDFETFTAPYDPLFFLHHTQLDRLWYIWQHRDIENRSMAYGGHSSRHTLKLASIEDDIKMAGLAASVKIKNVMETEGEMLSYRY